MGPFLKGEEELFVTKTNTYLKNVKQTKKINKLASCRKQAKKRRRKRQKKSVFSVKSEVTLGMLNLASPVRVM